nr:hypothetical protein [uncultured Anaerobutyricum sp.]
MFIRILNTLRSRIWDMVLYHFFLLTRYLPSKQEFSDFSPLSLPKTIEFIHVEPTNRK